MRPILALLLFIAMHIPAFAQKATILYLGAPAANCITPDTMNAPEEEYTFAAYIGSRSVEGGYDYVSFQISNASHSTWWSLSFAMPQGQTLATGEYLNATKFESPSHAGISLDGNGCAYNTVGGLFTIHEITFEGGKLSSFAADFIQFSEMALASWTSGSIRFDSNVPVEDFPPEPVNPVSIACTNPEGPLIVESGYQWESTCIAGGGVSPFTWSFLNLPSGLEGRSDSYAGISAITISGRPSSGSFDYTVTATDSESNASSQRFTGNATYPDCVPRGTYRTLSYPFHFPPSGGIASPSFRFISNGCPWTISTDIPGVTFSPASGITLGYDSLAHSSVSVPANNGPTPLTGYLYLSENGVVVLSYPVVVNSSACSYTVNPASGQFGPKGGSGTFAVTGNPAACHPVQLQNYWWLKFEDGLYYYEIPPNSGGAQSGSVGFGNFSGDSALASFSWEQGAGDGSLVMNCYKPGASKLNSPIAACRAAGGTPPYTWSVIGGAVPGNNGLVSSDSNSISFSNASQSGPYQFTVRVRDSSTPIAASATYSVSGTVLPAPPKFQCSIVTVPTQTDALYKSICVPIDGIPPYRWSISEGALPPGIVLSELGDGLAIISGIPSSTGSYSYTLQLTDSTNPMPMTATQFFLGSIGLPNSESERFRIGCAVNDEALQIGFPIRPIICTAYGGTAPYSWSVHSGRLPTGLEFSNTTGDVVTIEGIPSEKIVGDHFDSYIKAIDSSSTQRPRIRKLHLKVAGPTDFSCSPVSGKVGHPYSSACERLPLDTWISNGQLPPGLNVSYAGISGTPTTPGTYTFEISAQLGIYPAPANTYTMEIASDPASITIRTNPDGLSFSADGEVYSSPYTFTWLIGSKHTISIETQQATGEGMRNVFANWSDGGTESHTISVPSSATTYTANLTAQYKLTASASPPNGGMITTSPASADGYFAAESRVQLTATADSFYSFAGWGGDLTGDVNPQAIVVNAPRNITAFFEPLNNISSITITTNPVGNSFMVDGATYTSSQTFIWEQGSRHTISVTSPQAAFSGTRHIFVNWSDGGARSHTFTVPDVTTTFTANFTTQYLLTTFILPQECGSIGISPTSADGYYAAGTAIQLRANAASGYRFAGWSGSATGTMNPKTIAMSRALNVSATFQPAAVNRPLRLPAQSPNRVRKKRDIRDLPD